MLRSSRGVACQSTPSQVKSRWRGVDARSLVTATFYVNAHRCVRGVCSPLVHLGRSLGGPIVDLLTGLAALAANAAVGSRRIDFFAKASLVVGAWTALPIPGFDGWVIWGELLGFGRRTP